MMNTRKKSTQLKGDVNAVGGLLLTGAGLSMAIDAGTKKAKGSKWFFTEHWL